MVRMVIKEKFPIILIIFLTFVSLVLRAYRLTEPGHYYFDEVYHAVTAKAYADNNPAAYDPFSPAPKEGTAYDWLHPPLAKLIQAGSIKIFGDNSFGWRLPSVTFGTAIIPLTFILANVLFGSTVAIFAATVMAFENLALVMSRITMNDVFLVVFALSSFIFAVIYVRDGKFKNLFATSLFLGFSVATKWSGIYVVIAIIGYILINKLKKREFDFRPLLLITLPALIYLASYSQFWIQGHSIRQFVDLHKQIWWYQNTRNLKHSYGTTPLYCVPEGLDGPKTWCPWVLNVRGVYFSYEQYGERAGYIYALGNPLIFWAGIVAVSYLLGKLIEEKKKELALVLVGYFIFWLPWIFAPRILFLYHYLPSLPFLAISLGVSLATIYQTKLKIFAFVILAIFMAAFFYFYPISAGYPIIPESIDKYIWLSTWR